MTTLRELKQRERELFGCEYDFHELLEPRWVRKQQEKISRQLQLEQGVRIHNAAKVVRLRQMLGEQGEADKIMEGTKRVEQQEEWRRERKRRERIEKMVEGVVEEAGRAGLEEGARVGMRELQWVFLGLGWELSMVQLNELFMRMEAGRRFQARRMRKWIRENADFIGTK